MTPIVFVYCMLFVPFVALIAARVLFSLFALDLGASAFEVGLLAAATQAFPLLLSYGSGVLQDRFGSRWLLALGALVGGAGVALPYFLPGMAALYVASLLCGIWSVIVIVLTQSLVGMLSPAKDLARNFSHYTVLAWGSTLVGPLLAGYSIDLIGHRLASAAIAPFALLTLAMLWRWGGLLPAGERRSGPVFNLRAAFADRGVRSVLVVSGAVQIAMEMFPFFVPVYGHSLALSASLIGTLMASASLSAIAVCFLLPLLAARFGEEPLLAWSLVLGALSFALLPLVQSPLLIGAVCILYGVGLAGGQPLSTMLMFKRAPQGRPGEGMGLRMMTNSALRVAAPPAFGAIAAVFGVLSGALLTAAVIGAVGWRLARRAGPGRTP